jgi:hypothetical protein
VEATQMTVRDLLSLADRDLAAAQTMLRARECLLLDIALACHRAIVNLLTAAYLEHQMVPPPDTDNVLRLALELPWRTEMDAWMLQMLEWLNAYPILASQDAGPADELAVLLTEEKTQELLDGTKELFDWIRSRR